MSTTLLTSASTLGILAVASFATVQTVPIASAMAGNLPEVIAQPTTTNEDKQASLAGSPGNAERGRLIVTDRRRGMCLLCHTGPFPEERFQGTLAPDLTGIGARASVGELRLRLTAPRQINPASIMPSYRRTDGLTRVAPAFSGLPLLDADEIEDVVTFLAGLQ